ncbi:MAG TPA: enoyl-CoA hydratase-related protein, partial [Acidimicrobiales bacterium]|nr:enoyl-CoA hydratase-related protein [Acidimicrobiales bacterium]
MADASGAGTAPDQSDLLVDRSTPGVAVVTLNRPHRLNALTSDMLARFYQSLEGLGRDETCRAIV